MEARAGDLGDAGASAPEQWQPELKDVDVLITLTAWSTDALDPAHELVGDGGTGLEFSWRQHAEKLAGNREHFGFADGFSQPAIDGASTGPRNGEGTRGRWSGWRDLALGEFVLGRADEGGLEPPAPVGELGRDATFMVVRKLEQDVAAFRAYVAEQAERHGKHPDWIAARMIGRWKNGSSIAKYPDAPGPPPGDDKRERARTNEFSYDDDPDGHACPLGAHVRRANPRDALGWGGRLTQRHRMLRRGMSYGEALPEDPTEPTTPADAERGLIFVSYQASIARQFEFVQRQWLGDGNVFGLEGDQDPIVGAGGGPMVIQGEKPLYLARLPEFVTTRGGDYFLVPGRAGLAAIAGNAC